MEGLILGSRFRVLSKIGEGSFGEIYSAVNVHSEEEAAVKVENISAKHPQLVYETRVIKMLEGGLGIPDVHWSGSDNFHNYMVMDMLGPNLEQLFDFCNRKFSLKTVLMIIDQLLCRIEYIHSNHFLHRDIKPDNFLLGSHKRCTIIYAIDFGLSKKYRDPKTLKHIPAKEGKSLTGTARYASCNTHIGYEQSRRDDLEAIGYVILYFLRGSLPWQGIAAKNRNDKYKQIMLKKKSTTVDELCSGFPEEFKTYMNYVKSLRFTEDPDYVYLRRLFKTVFNRESLAYDYRFDWVLLNHKNTEYQNRDSEKRQADCEKTENHNLEQKKLLTEVLVPKNPVTEKKNSKKCRIF